MTRGTKKIEKKRGGGGRNTELRLSQVFLCKIGREKKKTIQRTENILFDVCGGKCFPINCIIQKELWTTATRYTLRTKSIMSSNLFFSLYNTLK